METLSMEKMGGGGQGAARADQRYCSPHKQSVLKLGDTQ